MWHMAMASDDADRRNQFLRGTAGLLLLATIARSPGHAYELATRLSNAGLGAFSYGTVYPLLARLRSAGLLSEATHPSTRGPARKVYDLTPSGRATLQQWSTHWHHMHQSASDYLTTSAPHDNPRHDDPRHGGPSASGSSTTATTGTSTC